MQGNNWHFCLIHNMRHDKETPFHPLTYTDYRELNRTNPLGTNQRNTSCVVSSN